MKSLRERFEFVPGQHKPHPFRNGIILLVLCAFALYSGYTRDVPFVSFKKTETVRAAFDRAVNTDSGFTAVRVHGVDVGKVQKVERNPAGGVILTMKIDKSAHVKVHEDARAGIWWRTLLGRNMYVELDPGSPSSPPLGDRILPLSHTTTQVEFDEMLASYDDGGRKGVQAFIDEFDQAFKHPGAPARTIDALRPSMRTVAGGLPALRGTRPGRDLPDIARSASRALGALSRNEADLAGTVEGADTTFSVTAARRDSIASMLQQAPATMDQSRATMARVRTTLDTLDPIAEALRPGLRRLDDSVAVVRPALRELMRVLPVANPFLRQINPALADLQTAAREGVPLMRDFEPTLRRTNERFLPWLDKPDSEIKLKTYQAIGPFFAAIDSTASEFDSNGHMQRFQPGNGERSAAASPCQTGLVDPNPPHNEIAACEAVLGTLYQVLGVKGGSGDAKHTLRAKRPVPAPAVDGTVAAAGGSSITPAAGEPTTWVGGALERLTRQVLP